MRVKVEGGEKFRRAAQLCREADRTDLRRELMRGMRAAGQEILDDQRAEVRGLRVSGRRFYGYGVKRVTGDDGTVRQVQVRYRPNKRSTGLRDRVARSLALELKSTGKARVRFIAKPEKLPAGQQNMPRNLDKPKGWRHPVFGDTEMWVTQVGGSWFWPPIQKGIRTFRQRIDEAITAVVNKIERG
ncbi:hypothetical protein ACGFI9_12120 [Micromonospora sp. NPDC048930]|uniref:hypothetical protein n=1 Tax=Micromonospora sp. NPDC048930 TaxID=3364261 RepID=UPI0037193DE2